MTDEEMRKLDEWIAVNAMDWKSHKPEGSETLLAWLSYNDRLKSWTWTGFWNHSEEARRYSGELHWSLGDGSVATVSGIDGSVWEPTRKADQLKRVKREIERRGWSWRSEYFADRIDCQYQFMVFMELRVFGRGKFANTEELAGCLAFKAAVEATEKMTERKGLKKGVNF